MESVALGVGDDSALQRFFDYLVSVGMYLSSRVEDDSRSSDVADIEGGDETRTVYTTLVL